MEHVPNNFVPAACAGSSISVTPVIGNVLLIPKEGMLMLELQSKVFLVVTLKVVGLLLSAVKELGLKPAFAVIEINCLPSVCTSALLVFESATAGGLAIRNITTPMIRTEIEMKPNLLSKSVLTVIILFR